MDVCELSQLITNFLSSADSIRANDNGPKTEQKVDRDDVLVKLVEVEDIIWRRNHPQFKNVVMKEQAWGRISLQLGISSESFANTNTHESLNHFPISSLVHSFFPSADVRNDVLC
jgi:hypothetical protein